jgi:hypothetical protein
MKIKVIVLSVLGVLLFANPGSTMWSIKADDPRARNRSYLYQVFSLEQWMLTRDPELKPKAMQDYETYDKAHGAVAKALKTGGRFVPETQRAKRQINMPPTIKVYRFHGKRFNLVEKRMTT